MAAPEREWTTWDETLELIEMEPVVWIRMAAVLSGDEWQVRILEATSGVQPPQWEQREWRYPTVWFVAINTAGADVGTWFRQGRVVWAEQEVALPPSEGFGRITWDRQGSGSQPWFERLRWPTAEARMPANWNPPQQEPMGMLLGEDVPSFVTFYAAAAAFFLTDRQPIGGQIMPTVTYRHADTSGRIPLVRIEQDRVQVQIEGRRIDGMTVELAGDVPGPRQAVQGGEDGAVVVEFPVADGLPSGAWVVLKSGSRWVDRHFLTHPFRREAEAGVEWVIEPTTKLEGLLAGRERLGVEFKSEVPRRDATKFRMMRTVAAFANGNGGSILVGVTDDRDVVGIPSGAVAGAIDALTEMVSRWVTPPPPHSFEELPVGDDGTLFVLEFVVHQGTHLYGAGKPGETPLVYVRPYSTTERAWPSEIEDIVRTRQAGQQPSWLSHQL